MINQHIKVVCDSNYSILLNPDNLAWIKVKNETLKNLIGNIEWLEEFIRQISVNYHFFRERDNNTLNINTVYFSVTNFCNMNCEFCTLNSSPFESSSNDMPLELIRKIIKKIIIGFKPSTIVITGGEPTTRKDLNDILDICQEYRNNCSIMLQTNGLDLNGDIIKQLVTKLDLIEISIEHIIGTNHISSLHKTLKYLKKSDLDVRLSYVIDKNNQNSILSAIDLCHQYDAAFIFRFAAAVGRAISSNILLTDNEIKKNYLTMSRYLLEKCLFSPKLTHGIFGTLNARKMCGAWGKTMGVRPDGKVQMCGNLTGNIFNYGDLTVDTIDVLMYKIKSKMENEELKSKFSASNVKVCLNCFARYFCGGACTAELENIDNGKYQCSVKKLYLLYLMFHYDKKCSVEENLTSLIEFLEESDIEKKFSEVNAYDTSLYKLYKPFDNI